MDLNLSGILQQTDQAVQGFDSAAGQIANITGQLADVTAQKVQSDQDAADAAALVKGTELTNQAQQEQTRQAIAARLGTNANLGAAWIVGQSADIMKTAGAAADAAQAAIHEKTSINPLQNPLGWIMGKMTVGKDYSDYNYYASQYNDAEQRALDADKMTQDAIITQNAIGSTIGQAYINASKVLAAHTYTTQAQDAQAQGLRWNLDGVVQAAALSKDKLTALFQANNAVNQSTQIGLEQQRLVLAKGEFNLRAQAAAEKTDEDSLIQKYIQRGYFNLTGQQMDPSRAKDAIILFKSKQPQVMQYFQNGMESTAAGRPVISNSPYDATTLIGTRVAQNLSPAQQQVADQLITWRKEFESPAIQGTLNIDPKDRTARERAFNSFVSNKVGQDSSNTGPNSIFAPVSIEQTAASNPNIAALPAWTNVLKPAADAGVNIDDPNTAFSLIASGLSSGKLKYSDAVDAATIYRGGLALNNQSKNFISMGLPPVNTYNTQVRIPGTIGKTTINLADDKAISAALNRMMARTLSMRAQAGVGSGAVMNNTDLAQLPGPSMPDIPVRFGSPITYPGNEEERLRALRGAQ